MFVKAPAKVQISGSFRFLNTDIRTIDGAEYVKVQNYKFTLRKSKNSAWRLYEYHVLYLTLSQRWRIGYNPLTRKLNFLLTASGQHDIL